MFIDFDLPEELIATHPAAKRDRCKMLVYDRVTEKIHHTTFDQLATFLDENYFLVLNQARVNPCRIYWKDTKDKQQEIVFLKHIEDQKKSSVWEAIVSGKNIKVNHPYIIAGDFFFTLIKPRENVLAHIRVNKTKIELEKMLAKEAQLPLPPYILKRRKKSYADIYIPEDNRNYQTIFSKNNGAVAAPTAGLHFTEEVFESLKQKKVDWDFVHLSVGWGTFMPMTQDQLDNKKLHPEFCSIAQSTAKKIIAAKQMDRKILAVGTTVVRTLESWALNGLDKKGFEGETDIFILPNYRFHVPDALITNFHFPQSTLLLLVAAFLGENGSEKIKQIYEEAIEKNYRFYSYGDCMLIL